MTLAELLTDHDLNIRRRHQGDDGRRLALAFAALREYLLEYAGLIETEQVTSAELFQFLLDYYPGQEEPETEVALALLDVAAGLSRRLLELGDRGTLLFAETEDLLRSELPRVIEALRLLREYTRRNDVRSEMGLAMPAEEGEEDEESIVAAATGGLDLVQDLEAVRFEEAQMDYFTVLRVDDSEAEGRLALASSSREILGEGIADPVRVPTAAAKLIRANDILYAEIAPGRDGWELLGAFALRPEESA